MKTKLSLLASAAVAVLALSAPSIAVAAQDQGTVKYQAVDTSGSLQGRVLIQDIAAVNKLGSYAQMQSQKTSFNADVYAANKLMPAASFDSIALVIAQTTTAELKQQVIVVDNKLDLGLTSTD